MLAINCCGSYMVVLCSQSGPLQNPVCMKGALLTQCTKNDSHVFNRVSMFSTFLVQHFHFQHCEGRGTCLPQHACGGQGNARDLDLFPCCGSWRFNSGCHCLCLMSRLVGPHPFLSPKSFKSLSSSVLASLARPGPVCLFYCSMPPRS